MFIFSPDVDITLCGWLTGLKAPTVFLVVGRGKNSPNADYLSAGPAFCHELDEVEEVNSFGDICVCCFQKHE